MFAVELRPSRISNSSLDVSLGEPLITGNTFNGLALRSGGSVGAGQSIFGLSYCTTQSTASGGMILAPSMSSYSPVNDEMLDQRPSVEPDLKNSFDCDADKNDKFAISDASSFSMCVDGEGRKFVVAHNNGKVRRDGVVYIILACRYCCSARFWLSSS